MMTRFTPPIPGLLLLLMVLLVMTPIARMEAQGLSLIHISEPTRPY